MSSTNSSCAALLSAVKQMDYAETQKLLSEHGLPIDEKYNDYKILIHAVHAGNTKIVRLLLKHNCRVKSPKSNFCKTPLCYAVNNNDLKMVKVLLDAGASIIDKDHNKNTPLKMAMDKNFYQAVDLMLSKYDISNIDPTNKDELFNFYIACSRNNSDLVKSFISRGMNVNGIANSGVASHSPLHIAVSHQSVEVVEVLLCYGADYTYLSETNLSPLHVAYYLEDSKDKYLMMDYMIYLNAANASANPVNSLGLSHFHIACTRQNKEAVENFLKSGVDVNCAIPGGNYPLHFAVESGHDEIVEILLKHRANVNAKACGLTPLHIAIKQSPVIAKILLKYGANVCVKDQNDCTPIHIAYYNLLKCREILSSMMVVHQGKMLNFRDKNGLSIFHIACAVGCTKVVENFLQRNIDVNSSLGDNSGEFSGFTALHFAAMNFHEDIVKLLLRYKANVNAVDKNGRLPIWFAVQFVVSEFMACKLNENVLHKEAFVYEEEAMKFMCQKVRKIPIIKLLVENKSNLNRVNENGILLLYKAFYPDVLWRVEAPVPNRNLIQYVCEKYNSACRKEILDILIENGIGFYVLDQKHNSILHLLAADSELSKNLETAKLVLDRGCNPNYINKVGKTALHIVAENGFLEFVKLLLNYKANPNCKDKSLSTPLHYAVKKNFSDDDCIETSHAKIIQLLIDNGVDVDALDAKGCTPLFATVQQKQSIKALEYLLKANCQVNLCNDEGLSPLFIAAGKNNAVGVKLLLDYGADINLKFKSKYALIRNMIEYLKPLAFFDYCFIDTYKVLEIHIEKLRLIDYPVSISDLKYRRHCEIMLNNGIFTNISTFYDQHKIDGNKYDLGKEDNFITPMLKTELEKMKVTKIDRYTSLYDILFKNERQMVKHVNNETFEEYLEDGRLYGEFENYGYLLKLKYREGMERYILLEPAKESLRQLIGQDLPDLCLDGIFDYLSSENLKNLSGVHV